MFKKKSHYALIVFILLFSYGCNKENKNDTAVPLQTAVQSYLLLVKDAVANIVNPATNEATEIPDFDLLYEAAGTVETRNNPPQYLATIFSLLGRAGDYDCKVPDSSQALQFPKDHHLHPEMGQEWYYIGVNLNVIDPDGNVGRIGLLLSMVKQRIVGLATQTKYNFSDKNSMLFTNLATATVDFPGNKKIIRRNQNTQLPSLGGNASYSSNGENFKFSCGTDSLSGSVNVLPLLVEVNDGANLSFTLKMTPPNNFEAENAFFLQGVPKETLDGGTGYTNVPSPGLYYSWPQLKIDASSNNTLRVDGVNYNIIDGTAWMDHQIMMQSLKNPNNAVHPIPFTEDYEPYNGWSWQYFNLNNGSSLTGASFQHGDLNITAVIPYGYYITPNYDLGKWDSKYIFGEMNLKDFEPFHVVVNDPSSPTASIPTGWEYFLFDTGASNTSVNNVSNGIAVQWYSDATFNSQSLQILSESPVDYIDDSGDESKNGVGFCESIGFEKVDDYRVRALNYLETEQ